MFFHLTLLTCNLQVYTKDEIPEELHWKDDANIPPILVLAHNRTVILSAPATVQRPGNYMSVGGYSFDRSRLLEQTKQGISGYDPEELDMRGVFMARGPAFVNTPVAQPPIEVVDLYNMFCHILGIKPVKNDGIWERIKGLLKNDSSSVKAHSVLVILLALVAQYLY